MHDAHCNFTLIFSWKCQIEIIFKFLLQEADDSEDFDFIDLEDVVGTRQRCPSSTDAPSPLASQIVNLDLRDDQQPPSTRPLLPANPEMEQQKKYTQDCDQKTKIVVIPPSVESDYPELSSDFALKSSNSSNNYNSSNTLPSNTIPLVASPLNKSQIISRRLKLDLRNECDIPIAGIRNWNRPNSAATGTSVTLYERHPHTAEHAGNPIADTFAVVIWI